MSTHDRVGPPQAFTKNVYVSRELRPGLKFLPQRQGSVLKVIAYGTRLRTVRLHDKRYQTTKLTPPAVEMAHPVYKTAAKTEKNTEAISYARELEHVPWCEDYEKMISGMLYDAGAPELVQSRFRSNRITHRYNTWFPDDVTLEALTAEREKMVRDVFGRAGESPWLEAPFYVDYGCNISVGDRFYANFNLTILDCALVTIGHRVMIGPNVNIMAATHDVEVGPRRAGLEYARGVSIGDDCWIGGGVNINAGVSIGEGSTIGSGSTVTRDIPPFSVAVGSPARVVKTVEPEVFHEETSTKS